jgi:TatD DNase family protein
MSGQRPEDHSDATLNAATAAELSAASCASHRLSFFDTHAHLDLPELANDQADVVARAAQAGVDSILCVGIDVDSSLAALRCAEQFGLWASVGIHPNSTVNAASDAWDRILSMLDHPRAVALGETGLDQYWDDAPLALQQDYFDRHIQLAQQRDLPVIIHCRDAQAEMMPMLRTAANRGHICGVLHAFSGDADMAAECMAMGLHISFAGNVTYSNKKFETLRAAAKTIPLDRLLIETDSPFLNPQIFRGKRPCNEPAYVVHTAQFLADLRGEPLKELAAATTTNAHRLFIKS